MMRRVDRTSARGTVAALASVGSTGVVKLRGIFSTVRAR
jgi:hypothetical protein